MTTRFNWAILRLFGGGAIAMLLATQSFGQAPPPKPDTKADTKDAAEAAKDTKDDAKDITDDAKDAADDARDDEKDRAEDKRNTAKDDRDDVKDQTKDSRDAAKGRAKDARDSEKDSVKDGRDRDPHPSDRDRDAGDRDGDSRDRDRNSRDRDRDAADRDPDAGNSRGRDRDVRVGRDRDAGDVLDRGDRDVRDRDSQDRDVARERDGDSRERDSSTESRASSRTNFRAGNIRSADIGLWFDASVRDGLVISDVATSGSIAKLGFQEGDRIISVDGRRVMRERDFVEYLFTDDLRDQRVKVIVLRDDAEEVVWVEPAVLVEDYRYVDNDPVEHFGVVLDDRYDDRIVVWKVIPQSPAYYAGIRAGDVFTTFRGQDLTTREDFVRVVRDLNAGEVPVQVTRNDRVRDFRVDVPEFQARTERPTDVRPNVDVERPNEVREQRIEERREDRQNVTPPRAVAPGPGRTPAPGRQRLLRRRR